MLAIRSQRDPVREIWLPSLEIRQVRELARFRLHLVKHRVPATLVSSGKPCPVDLFGVAGRHMLADLQVPEPWRSTLEASVAAIDGLAYDQPFSPQTAAAGAAFRLAAQTALLDLRPRSRPPTPPGPPAEEAMET